MDVTVAAKAAATTSDCVSCGVRSAAWMPAAFSGMSRQAGALERRADLGHREPGSRHRIGRLGQQLQRVHSVQVLERRKRCGEVLAQRIPHPLAVPGSLPDQRLVRSGHDLNRLDA